MTRLCKGTCTKMHELRLIEGHNIDINYYVDFFTDLNKDF